LSDSGMHKSTFILIEIGLIAASLWSHDVCRHIVQA
jgi:hypothetical protein